MNGMVEKAGRLLSPGFLSLLSSRAIVTSLALLLLLDLVFVLMHFAHLLALRYGLESVFQDSRFRIETESGFSERFEYAKTAVCVFALLGCWVRTRQPIYAAAALVVAERAADLREGASLAAAALDGGAAGLAFKLSSPPSVRFERSREARPRPMRWVSRLRSTRTEMD